MIIILIKNNKFNSFVNNNNNNNINSNLITSSSVNDIIEIKGKIIKKKKTITIIYLKIMFSKFSVII